MNEPELIHTMLANAKTIAVIGATDNPAKPSHYVPAYMQRHGYKVYPINPTVPEALGEKSYASLSDLIAAGIKPDIVDVFRPPQFLPAIVDEMLQLGLDNLWVQQGIVNPEAAARAESGGIHVVMDHCIMVEHRRM